MSPDLYALAAFCDADRETRFMEIQYVPGSGPRSLGHWEVAICLGDGWTCTSPQVVGNTRWLTVRASTYVAAVAKARQRTTTVRPLALRPTT